ncbi:hypothetical protein C8J33_1032 [Rhizobium sp. PP-CC-3G-465]|nr:hypothetical protein C8J33_1032 [Rhizobium sp. PP-CC-3G-465]
MATASTHGSGTHEAGAAATGPLTVAQEGGEMRLLIALACLAGTLLPPAAYAHGGGCRKDSPPGQCCHMNRKTGQSHCH